MNRDRKYPCSTCKTEFSIKAEIEKIVKLVRIEANRNRKANLALDGKITVDEFDFAISTLPNHIPSQVTSSASRRLEQIRAQLGGESNGDVVWTGTDGTLGGGSRNENGAPDDPFAGGAGFGDPHSASFQRRR